MMKWFRVCILAVGWTLVAGVSADIIWSGDMHQRTYHDIAAIDFNLDGTDDFIIRQEADIFYQDYYIGTADGQILVDDPIGFSSGYPLVAGTTISATPGNPDVAWTSTETYLFGYGEPHTGERDYGGFFGGAGVVGDEYLGISFEVAGATHYGWIEMSHDRTRPVPENQFLYIHGWAWETEADTPIIAGTIPEPSSGILAILGTFSLLQLARFRRRRKLGRASIPRCRSPQVRCGFSAERCVAPVLCGNADRTSALRFRSRIQKASAAPEKW